MDVKLCCLHLYNTKDCTKRGVKYTVYNTSGRIHRIIHCVLALFACSLAAITVSRCACKKMCVGCFSSVVVAGDLMMMMMMMMLMDVVGVAHLFVWCC